MTVYQTSEPEHGEAFLADAYGAAIRFRAERRGYHFRHARYGPGPFYLETFDHAATTDALCGPFPLLACLRMERGVRTDVESGETFGPGDLAVNSRPGEQFRLRYEDAGYTAVMLPPEEVAAVAGLDDPPELRFHSVRPVSDTLAQGWLQTFDYVSNQLRCFPEAVAQPLLGGPMARLLAAAMLAAFPSTWAPGPEPADRTDATPGTVRRAIRFIEDNADLDIGVADVARSCGVTVRAVQLAFRRHLEQTPMAYLRRVRLAHAHEELTAASRDDGLTVTQIAARWGFADPTRFTTRYRRHYGEPPDTTLDR